MLIVCQVSRHVPRHREGESSTQLGYDSIVERQRVRGLLCLHVTQLALTLGCSSFLSLEGANTTLDMSGLALIDFEEEEEISLVAGSDQSFQICAINCNLGRSSRNEGIYNDLVKDFRPLLKPWFERFQDFHPIRKLVFLWWNIRRDRA